MAKNEIEIHVDVNGLSDIEKHLQSIKNSIKLINDTPIEIKVKQYVKRSWWKFWIPRFKVVDVKVFNAK